MKTTDIFGTVKDMARKAGISIAELCRRAGVSRGTLTRWEKGETSPTFRVWAKLENAAKSKRDAA